MKPKKANEIFVEVENQEDNQVLTTTKSILYDACSGSSGNLKKRKLTQKIIPENDLIEVIDSNTENNMVKLSFNLKSLGTSMTPSLKKNKLSKQMANEIVLPQRRTRSGNMSKKTKVIEGSIDGMETEIGKEALKL